MNYPIAKKKSKGNKSRLGFSLVEMLIVVAIIAILVGISVIGINKYRRSLKLIETDGLAKEVYVAAQNNLTMAFSQGYLGISDFGTADVNEAGGITADDGVYYFIVGSDYQYKTAENSSSALDLMLPSGTIDSVALKQGNLIVRYQKSTGTVLDVFYAPADGFSFSHVFGEDDYQKLIYNDGGNYRSESELRKNYGTGVIGYCGNYDGPIKSIDEFNLPSPSVRGINDSILYAVITYPEIDDSKYDDEKYIYVTGKDGKKVTFIIYEDTGVVEKISNNGVKSTFHLGSEGAQLVKVTKEGGENMPGGVNVPKDSYILILDDITEKNLHFTDLYPSSDGWEPGEDISIQAEIKLEQKGNTSVTNSAKSNKVTLNSIFGNKDDNEVTINNIRQLENLDPEISGFEPEGKIIIEQNSNIPFDDFIKELEEIKGEEPEITKKGGNDDPSDPGTFSPIDATYPFEYRGNDHTIEELKVKTEGPAGLFGEITGGGTVIKDLFLINPDVWSYDGNAGALVATVKGNAKSKITITGVAAYNARPVDADSSWNDANIRVHAAWSAGGLIGFASYVDVTSCSASLYVEAYPKDYIWENMNDPKTGTTNDGISSNAGGFIGRTDTCTITGCYAGGHTLSGKYLSNYEGNGRVNVVGAYYSGGFGGILKTTTLNCCYTTCSVGSNKALTGQNATIAGFAAKISYGSVLNYCYTVGRVVGSTKSCTYDFWAKTGSFTGSHNYSLEDISLNTTARANDATTGVSTVNVESKNSDVISYEESRYSATTYDTVLMVDSEGKYYFLTIDQLYEKAGLTNKSKENITNIQYGDWQVPSSTTSSIGFINGDTLELWIKLDTVMQSTDTFLTVGIKGETSKKTRTYLFNIKDSIGGTTVEYTPGYIANGDIKWINGAVGNTLPAVMDANKTYLIITLDDVTAADKHFYQIFGTADSNLPESIVLTPGENITAYVAAGVIAGEAQLTASSSDFTNSLFDYGSNRKSGIRKDIETNKTTNFMYATNCRHLQNMCPAVSGLNATDYFAKGYLTTDIEWTAPYTNGIYDKTGETKYDGFRGITYAKIKLFDGQGHTLKNFKFASVYSSDSSTDAFYSGLFARFKGSDTEDRTFAIKNLIILNPTVMSDSSSKVSTTKTNLLSYAGALIARADGKVNITIDTVQVISDSATGYAITAKGLKALNKTSRKVAGGLIGCLDTSATANIIINNSSVSANVKSYSTDYSSDSNCYTGGLIGWVSKGTVSIQNSYVGGHTIKGNYNTSYWNIVGYRAGGFIGLASDASNGTISISYSFVTASVKGVKYAGSFVGNLKRKLVLTNVYTVAPVYKAADASKTTMGALFGKIEDNGEVVINKAEGKDTYSAYYLPECYGVDNLSISQLVGTGSEKVTGDFLPMYYDIQTGKVTSDDVRSEVSVKKGGFVILTRPFDQTLIDTGKEYPFNCWTVAPSAKESEEDLKSFTGDWKIEGIAPAETHKATFYYITRNSDGSYGFLKAPENNVKNFVSGSNAEIIVPPMDSLNPGFSAATWYVGGAVDTSSFNFTSWSKTQLANTTYDSEKGILTLPSTYTKNDVTIIFIYKQNPDTYTVNFQYDKTGKNEYTQANSANIIELGSAQIVERLSEVLVPNCSVNKSDTPYNKDMTFIGWYSDKACTKLIDFSKSDKLTASVNAYAKFGYKYTVKVNYFYNDKGTLKTLLATSNKYYLSSDALPKVQLLEGASETFLSAYSLLYVKEGNLSTGTAVTTTTSGNSAYIQLTKADDITFYAVYEPKSEDFNLDYTVRFVFANTASSSWAYSENSSKTVTVGTYHAYSTADLIMVGEGTAKKSFSDYFSTMTEANSKKCADGFIITGYTLPTPTNAYLTINVERRKFALSADANTGAYIEPVEVEYGKPISSVISTATLERKGYTFPTDFNQRWKYYKLGEASSTATAVSTTTPMPSYDTVLLANWIPGTANYTVIFWYENANDTNFTYGGLTTAKGTTGTTISTDTWANYNGLTSGAATHVHSISCYPGTSNTAFDTEREEAEGACESGDKYWVVNGKKIDEDFFNPDAYQNSADGYVHVWRYEGDTNQYKCIKIGDEWYVYNGATGSAQLAECEGASEDWLTNEMISQFTYSKDRSYLAASDRAGHEVIAGDGSTTLNIYFARNRYHFYIELSNGNYSHTHTDSCYSLACGIPEHTHSASCLSCKTMEHTHNAACCSLTEHTHTSACCSLPVHNHATAGCSASNCTHTTHTYTCYGATGATSDDYVKNTSVINAFKSVTGGSLVNGYIYRFQCNAGSDNHGDHYYLYLNGNWYNIDSNKIGSQYGSSKSGNFYYSHFLSKRETVYAYYSKLTCTHTHTDACYSCGLVNHNHTTGCNSAKCSVGYAHTHGVGCNATNCTVGYSHVHSDANGCYKNCNAEKHTHTSACYTLTCKLAECTAANGKNYAAILYAKYQQNISAEWEKYVNTRSYHYWWDDVTHKRNSKLSDYFNHYIYSIDIMPGQDLYFTDYDYGSSYINVYYYLEAVPGKTTSTSVGGKYFELYTTGKPNTGGWSYTYEEEFYNILGFTQYAFKRGSSSLNYDPEDIDGYSINADTYLYYTRDSFSLQFYVDNALVKSYSVKSDEVLDSYCNSASTIRPSYVESDYSFGGWYLDQACTKPYVAGSKMPIGNYILYGKWLPPIKTVTFKLTESGSTFATAKTYKYSTLEGIITDKTTNEYLSDYSPSGLAYWYYRENGVKKRFIPQKQITENMTLYAEFANTVTTSEITVKYRLKGTSTLIGPQVTKYTYNIGAMFAVSPATISGYAVAGWRLGDNGVLHNNTNASLSVSENKSENVIVFEYEEEIKWTYTVKYVALYKSLTSTTATIPGVTLSSTIQSKELSSFTRSETISSSETRIIEFSVPAGYENYALDHYTVDGNTVNGCSYEYLSYNGSNSRTIVFYITPDTDKCGVSDLHFEYDGTDKLKNIDTSLFEKHPALTVPTGFTAKLDYYYSFEGTSGALTSAIHAGSYKVKAYCVLTVTNNSKTYKYLLWKAEDSSVRLVIDPKTIRLGSGSKTAKYSPDSVLTDTEIFGLVKTSGSTSYSKVSWTSVFCGNDAASFETVFVIDAFRLDVGTSQNAFIIQLKEGADEKLLSDYLIETEFGTLTVDWSYKVVYKFRYRTTDDAADTVEPLVWDISSTSATTLTDLTKTVKVSFPTDWKDKNFRLVYEYGGKTIILGNSSSYNIEIAPEISRNYNNGPSELVVYVEPNVSLIDEYIYTTGKTVTYNGQNQKLSKVINTSLFNVKRPSGVSSAKLSLSTVYTNGAGEVMETVIDAGTYYSTSKLILTVKLSDGKTKKYTLLSDSTKDVRVTVVPLEVTVTSPDSTAYIDENGKIVFAQPSVTTSNSLLSTSMFTPVYSAYDTLSIGNNENGNYFSIKWTSTINPNNFKITRVYGDLTVSWRAKISYYLRPATTDVYNNANYINYSGVPFDRTSSAYRVITKNGTKETVTVITFTSENATISVNKLKELMPSQCAGYEISSDYRFNNVSYKYEDGVATVSPYVNAYGKYGANEIRVYVNPTVPQAALTAAKTHSEYSSAVTLPSNLDGISSVSSRIYTKYVYLDSARNVVNDPNKADTLYTYLIMEVNTVRSSSSVTTTNNYLLYFNKEAV